MARSRQNTTVGLARLVGRLGIVLALPLAAAVLTFTYVRGSFFTALDPNATAPKLVIVDPNKTFNDLCIDLGNRGIIRHWWSLRLLAALKKGSNAIKEGEYQLTSAMTPLEILDTLREGKLYLRDVTVEPGMSIWEIGDLLYKAKLLAVQDFNTALANPELLALGGIDAESFEGYLSPGAYRFSRPVTAQRVIWAMLERSETEWKPEFGKQAEELSLSRHEIVTLASIVQRESLNEEEKPILSSVIHNRLRQGMKLQSDQTVIYGLPKFDGQLTRENLRNPTPYNTYLKAGLPPGPICNPGEAAITAALFPHETEYLFFAPDGKGGHLFSTTLKEHQAALRRFSIVKD